jgi:hypothetical protein
MSWTQGRTLHRTRTGRAKPNGKTTRQSLAVRKTKYASGAGQDRPLPLDMACHPQALTPTPVHPGCRTDMSSYNVGQWEELTVEDFVEGYGLHHIPWDDMWVVRWPSGDVCGYAPPNHAMSWKRAAERVGVMVNVFPS